MLKKYHLRPWIQVEGLTKCFTTFVHKAGLIANEMNPRPFCAQVCLVSSLFLTRYKTKNLNES
jgi:hypothetical protein